MSMQYETWERPEADLQDRVPGEKTHAAWQAYRMRRSLALVLLLGWVPLTVAVLLTSQMWSYGPVVSVAVILLWLLAACVAVWWAGEFRCPRCRRRYGAVGSRKGFSLLWRGLFDKVCNNCKLRKFEDFRSEGSNPGTLDRRMGER